MDFTLTHSFLLIGIQKLATKYIILNVASVKCAGEILSCIQEPSPSHLTQ